MPVVDTAVLVVAVAVGRDVGATGIGGGVSKTVEDMLVLLVVFVVVFAAVWSKDGCFLVVDPLASAEEGVWVFPVADSSVFMFSVTLVFAVLLVSVGSVVASFPQAARANNITTTISSAKNLFIL